MGKLVFDPKLDPVLEDVHRLVNEMFNSVKIKMDTIAYFDFIDGEITNAFAFESVGWIFVGVTLPLVKDLGRIADALISSLLESELISAANLEYRDVKVLWTNLFSYALLFVVFHECGHHACGHVSQSDNTFGAPMLTEYKYKLEPTQLTTYGQTPPQVQANLREQMDELDADRHAILTLAAGLLGHSPDQTNGESDDQVLSEIVISLGMFFLLVPESTQGLAGVNLVNLNHPPAALRHRFAMNILLEWLSENKPQALSSSLNGPAFGRVLDIAAQILNEGSDLANWNRMVDILATPVGLDYIELLRGSTSLV